MGGNSLWYDKTFWKLFLFICSYLTALTVIFFILGRQKISNIRAWASIKSWWITGPITFLSFAFPYPVPLIILTIIAVLGAKTFFKMTGMYHRTGFVMLTYLFIMLSASFIYFDHSSVFNFEFNWLHAYNMTPMFFLGCLGLIPILTNTTKHMIQYIALSLLIYMFLGWSFLHLGHILNLEKGIYILMYLFILTEVAESLSLLFNRILGKTKPFNQITSRVSLEAVALSLIITSFFAWIINDALPDKSKNYWLFASLIAVTFGTGGQLVMSVIRKDLGIKDNGVFILGKNDLLARLNKMIFVGPYFYYAYIYLQRGPF